MHRRSRPGQAANGDRIQTSSTHAYRGTCGECPQALSGLRDVPAEVFEGDVLGFGAAAHAGVEGREGGELVGGEFEVEYVEVLHDPLAANGLRDRTAAFMQVPADHDLCRGFAVGVGDGGD